MKILTSLLLTISLCYSTGGMSKEFDTKISMLDKGAVTYYVTGQVKGYSETDFMIDTGSGYTAINETMLKQLRNKTT